jgi:nuclear pore complex protein Nup205
MVYYQIARLGYFSPNEVQKSIEWLAANPNDTMTFYILAATLAAFDPADPHSFPGKVRKNLAVDKGTIAFMKRHLAPSANWKEPGLKATILLKWTLFMTETRHRDPSLENQQGFKTEELESQIWDAVQGDAFTYLATALIQFHKRTHTSPISSFAQFVQLVPEQQQKEPLAEEFQLSVLNMCDVLVRSLLTYASSELRKIKQRQEDLLTSVRTDRSRMFRSSPLPAVKSKVNLHHGTISPCCILSSASSTRRSPLNVRYNSGVQHPLATDAVCRTWNSRKCPQANCRHSCNGPCGLPKSGMWI